MPKSNKPKPVEVTRTNIPSELISKPHWVVLAVVWRDSDNGKLGKWTKPPYNPKDGS